MPHQMSLSLRFNDDGTVEDQFLPVKRQKHRLNKLKLTKIYNDSEVVLKTALPEISIQNRV